MIGWMSWICHRVGIFQPGQKLAWIVRSVSSIIATAAGLCNSIHQSTKWHTVKYQYIQYHPSLLVIQTLCESYPIMSIIIPHLLYNNYNKEWAAKYNDDDNNNQIQVVVSQMEEKYGFLMVHEIWSLICVIASRSTPWLHTLQTFFTHCCNGGFNVCCCSGATPS